MANIYEVSFFTTIPKNPPIYTLFKKKKKPYYRFKKKTSVTLYKEKINSFYFLRSHVWLHSVALK